MNKTIWIDLLNPSHPIFFHALLQSLQPFYTFQITSRNRAETVELARQFHMNPQVIGDFSHQTLLKTSGTIKRVFNLFRHIKPFDFSLSFENSDCIAVSKMKRKPSILFIDNDLKYTQKNNIIQLLENNVKLFANPLHPDRDIAHRLIPRRRRSFPFAGSRRDLP